MTTVNINEAKSHFSSLISSVETTGEPVIICRYGKAVARLVPMSRGRRTKTSPLLSQVEFLADPTESTEAEWSDA